MTDSDTPNTALRDFLPFIGTWNTTGTHGMMPGTTLHGRASFEWHESGAFVVMRSSIEDSRFPEGVAIFGSDDTLGTFSMLYFDERGVSRIQEVTIEGKVLHWHRNAPGFSQRYTLTLSEDGQSIASKGELSKDGTTWEQDLDLQYTKAKA